MLARTCIFAALVTLAGCTATSKDTFHLEQISIDEQTSGIAIDAKQRLIWTPKRQIRTNNKTKDGTVKYKEKRIICAEPSPDALTALSSNASTALDLAKGNETLGFNFEKAFSETSENIGKRTVTIQLLRDSLYRACEAYANGVINEFSYGLILSKLDNLMLKLVAIEEISSSSASLDMSGKEALAAKIQAEITLEQAKKDHDNTKTALANAKSRSNSANRKVNRTNNIVSELAKKITQNTTEISSLEKEIETLEKEDKPDSAKIESKRKTKLTLTLTNIDLESDKALKTANLTSFQAEAKTASDEVTRLTTALQNSKTNYDSKASDFVAKAKLVENSKSLTKEATTAIERIVHDSDLVSTTLSACLIYFSNNEQIKANETDTGISAMSWYCKKYLDEAKLQMSRTNNRNDETEVVVSDESK